MSAPPVPAVGRAVTGPSALAGDPKRFWALTRTLAVSEFKLRFFGSIFGYLWTLIRPLMLFGTLYVVFTQFLTVSNQPHFAVSLLFGIVLFSYFTDATSAAVGCVVDRENLVRKIHFPRLAIPMSVVLTATFNLALNMLVVLAFAFSQGIGPRWTWLEMPFLFGALMLLSVGFAALLSALFVRFRDIRPIWEVVTQVLFYASMILVPYETIHGKYPGVANALLLSPLASIIQQARHAFIDASIPGAAATNGGWTSVVVAVVLTFAIVAFGLWVFNREAPRVAEDL